MQQSSATPKNHDVGRGLRKIVACSQSSLETPVELPVSLFDSFGEFICSKGSSSIRYRVDWCINHRLQSNQFVGWHVEEEEKEKDGENRGLTDFRV